MSTRPPRDRVAGRYELGELLGRGGMADVYRATDVVLDRAVAIKMLRESTGNDTDRVRFTREATTLARLSHRGLVMLLDAGIEEERPFLVLELVPGRTLARTLAESGPLDVERVASMGAQLGEALAYAHRRGVVHRDVKPGNVLLGPDGSVKLADFGIARLIGDHVRHTRTGEAIGTAAYLAPEQVTGGRVEGAADTYSLGLLLLEALTGEVAYPGTPTEAAFARLSRPPLVPAWLPTGWRTLLEAMTRLDQDERPEAGEVAARLRSRATWDSDDLSVCGEVPAAGVLVGAERGGPADDAAGRFGTPRRGRAAQGRSPIAAALALLLLLLVAGAVAGRSHHVQLETSHLPQGRTSVPQAGPHRTLTGRAHTETNRPRRAAGHSRPVSASSAPTRPARASVHLMQGHHPRPSTLPRGHRPQRGQHHRPPGKPHEPPGHEAPGHKPHGHKPHGHKPPPA